MNPTQQSSHQDKKHPHSNARQLAFTGLATATLISGVGTTPVVLATQTNDEKTELTTSTTATEDATTPSITTPAPLPDANLTPTNSATAEQEQVPPNQPAVEAAATTTDETTSEKQNKSATLPNADASSEKTTSEQAAISKNGQTLTTKTKNKATRAVTVFAVSDFIVVNNVITGLTDDGLDKVNDTNWDGDFTFPTGLENVTSFNSYIFGGQFLDGSPDYNTYTRTRSSLVTVDLSNLTGLTEIPDDGFNGNRKLTTVKFGSLPNLTSVGQRAFFNCGDLQNFQYDSLPNLAVLGASSFMYCAALTSFDFNNLPGLTTIQSNAFKTSALHSINLSNLPLLATLGNSAFSTMPLLTTLTINNVPHLTTLPKDVFRYCTQLATLNLTNLSALTTIGDTAFGYDEVLETLDLSNLTALTTIANAAFFATGLQEVIVTNNPGLSIGTYAFVVLNSGGIVTPLEEAAVPTAIAIRDSINTDNAFADASAWYIPAKVTFKYVDQNNQPITEDANNNPLPTTSLDCHVSDTFTPADAPVIAGYSNPTMVGDDPQTVQHLTQEITFKYQAAAAQEFTVSYVDIHGNPLVDADNASGYVDDTLITDHYISDAFALPSTTLTTDNANYVYKELRRSNPNGGWNTIDQGDLPATFGDNAGQNYQFVYAEMNSVTQQYVDENNQPINFSDHRTISAEDGTAYDYSFANDTDDYYANGAPKIVGYDEPALVENSAPITGQILGDTQQVVTYQYKTIAKSGFIYRVDTDGNQLAAPEAFAGHISDQLDLNAAQQTFAGYQFTELYSGMPTLNRLLGVTDYTWKTAHALIGTTLTYGDNDGRSYKFVYTKNASNQAPDDSDTTTPPANKPSTGGSTSTPSQPTTSTPNQPAHLPTTGGNNKPKPTTPAKKPTANKAPKQLPASGGKQPQTATQVTPTSPQPTATNATKLPQSGSARNYLLPAVGATLLFGLASLVVFRKRR